MLRAALPMLWLAGAASAQAPDPPVPAEAVPVRLKFEVGQSLTLRVTSEKTVHTGTGDAESVRTLTEHTVRITPLEVAGDAATIRCEVVRLRNEATGPDGAQRFDSSDPHPEIDTAQLPTVDALIDRNYRATVTTAGVVRDIVPDYEGQARRIGIDYWRGFLEARYSWLPREPVAPEGRWSNRQALTLSGVQLVRENTLVWEDATPGRWLFRVRMTLSGGGAGAGDDGPGRRVQVDQAEPGTASILFDPVLGQVRGSYAATRFEIRTTDADGKATVQKLTARSRTDLLEIDGNLVPPAG